MGDDTVRRNLTIREDQDRKLNWMKENYTDLTKSLIARRALAYYFREGVKRDSVVRDLVGKDSHKDIVERL